MAEIDVDEVLADALVAGDVFQVIRRKEIVGSNGQSTLTAYSFQAYGAVQPGGSNELVREEGYGIQNRTLKVFTQFRLMGISWVDKLGYKYQPDLILWHSTHFIINHLSRWTAFGRGYVEAECVQFEYNGPPPEPAITPP